MLYEQAAAKNIDHMSFWAPMVAKIAGAILYNAQLAWSDLMHPHFGRPGCPKCLGHWRARPIGDAFRHIGQLHVGVPLV